MTEEQQHDIVISSAVPHARPAMPAIGFDSGLKNAASGGILFYAAQELCDEDGIPYKTIPVFDITGAERLDMTTGMIYRPSADWLSIERVVADPPSLKGTKLKEMAAHITQMVPKSPWMFKAAPSLLDQGKTQVLPMLVVENQPPRQVMEKRKEDAAGGSDSSGIAKPPPMDFRNDVLGPVAQHWGNTILTCDAVKFGAGREVGPDDSDTHLPLYPKRERVGAMSKYGLRCDGSRDRPERKEEAVDSLLELLSELGTPNSLQWFNWFTRMQEKGEQIHDMCDAISLAVQYCFMQYKKFAKSELRKLEVAQREEIKKRKALLNNIRQSAVRPKKPRKKKGADDDIVVFPDDNSGDSGDSTTKKTAATATKKKRAPAKKAAAKGKKKKNEKNASSSSSSNEEIVEKKKRAPRKKKVVEEENDKGKNKRKRSKSTTIKDNDMMSEEDGDNDIIILSSKDPVKKRAKKTVSVASKPELKYPILLLDEPLSKSSI